jgi:hypothetical protein
MTLILLLMWHNSIDVGRESVVIVVGGNEAQVAVITQ